MTSFAEGTRKLQETVGDGDLVGKVEFPGPYAAAQHEGGWVTGPLAGVRIERWTTPGTGPHFLSEPLMEHATEYMQRLADRTLEPHGLREAMVKNVEDLADLSSRRAPRLTGALQASPGTVVVDGGVIVHERPPTPIK